MGSDLISPTALLEVPYRRFQGGVAPSGFEYRETEIHESVSIGAYAIIGRGARIEEGVVIDDHCIVEPNATIRKSALLIYRAIVGGDTEVGPEAIVGGFVGERCTVGPRSRMFGRLIHKQLDTTLSWDEHDVPEPSPVVEADSFVGFDSLVIGGLTIGPNAYVCAGSIITRDVPSAHIAHGVNKIVQAQDWNGALYANPGLRRKD